MAKGFIMQSYFGSPCPYCGEKFAEGDDIVVCPECGTPHHRDCYKEHSACANEGKHGENYEWKSALSAAAPHKPHTESSLSGEPIVCAYCGCENTGDTRYCKNCGAPFGEEQPKPERRTIPFEEFQRERFRIFSESIGDNLGGITAKEAAVFVRSNIEYFLPRFVAFTKGVKFDTNFSAFIFSYFYLFYRKMYGLGIAVFAATAILSIPALLLDFMTVQEQYVEMGMLSQVIWEVPHQETLAIYSIIASLLIWIMRIALMMFFNRIYFGKVISAVKGARENLANESEKNISDFFRKKGGTSMVVPIILVLLTFAASFVLAGFIVSSEFFIMPDMANFI